MRLWRTVLAVAVVLGSGILVALFVAETPPAEVAELVAAGGERVLREPMRPARGGTRVIVFALDGVGQDELMGAIAQGEAPALAGLLGAATDTLGLFEHGWAAPGVLSILPSTTVAAWTSVFTGEPPARSGVPGNEWYERRTGRFYAPAPVSLDNKAHALRVYSDGLMDSVVRVPTLYELANVRAYASLTHVHRGADLLTIPSPESFGELVVAAARGVTDEREVDREAYARVDGAAAESLVESLEDHGLPDLLTVYFPGVDLYTHRAPNALDAERAYVRDVVDSAIALVLRAYETRGAMEETFVVITADHGHTPTLDDDRHALGVEGDDEPPALLRQLGFRVRAPSLEPDGARADHQAVLAYQGAFAFVYLADRSTCPRPGDRCDWRRPPRLGDDVVPVARAFHEANARGAHLPALRGTLDLIFVRTAARSPSERAALSVWDGEGLVPLARYLERHPRPDLPRLQERMQGLVDGRFGDHAGDVLLLARSGEERPIGERFYFSNEYRSWHGSPSRQDSEVPLVVARRGMRGEAVRALVRRLAGEPLDQLSVAKVVRGLVGAGATGEGGGK